MNTNIYTELIAGAHVGKERFTDFVYELTEPLRVASERLNQLYLDFDLDKAVGSQLDAVGVRVGISRTLHTKITGVYFALDDVDGKGLDLGVWKGSLDPSDGIVTLDDGTYRSVIKAKVALNHYDGTNEGMAKTLRKIFSGFGIYTGYGAYKDNQNMSITVTLNKDIIPPIMWEVFSTKVFTVQAAGVSMTLGDLLICYLATSDGDRLQTSDGDNLIISLPEG